MTSTDHRDRLPELGAGFSFHTTDEAAVLRPRTDEVAAVFTTRLGGVSEGPFATLNLSHDVGDARRCVDRNREIAGSLGGLSAGWARMRQVHGAQVVRAVPPEREAGEADAVWTDDPADALAVLVADCVPALLVGDGSLGAAHAGWRGLLAGVIGAASAACGARVLYAGPAIGPCCYEVGPEVWGPFRDRFGAAASPDDRHVDLWVAVEVAARDAGVADVYSARLCTSCHADLFFSHRRDGGRTGRQGLVAGLRR